MHSDAPSHLRRFGLNVTAAAASATDPATLGWSAYLELYTKLQLYSTTRAPPFHTHTRTHASAQSSVLLKFGKPTVSSAPTADAFVRKLAATADSADGDERAYARRAAGDFLLRCVAMVRARASSPAHPCARDR